MEYKDFYPVRTGSLIYRQAWQHPEFGIVVGIRDIEMQTLEGVVDIFWIDEGFRPGWAVTVFDQEQWHVFLTRECSMVEY